MTNDQNDDFLETGDLDADSGFEDFETGKMSLADAWKTNPMVKIGGVLGAVAIIIGGIMLFGGESVPVSPSVIGGTGKEAKEAPGGKVSDTYRSALQDMNEKSAEEARISGTSSLPVPIGQARGKVMPDTNKTSDEDPLERWRQIQEERLRKEQQVKMEPTAPAAPVKPVDPYAQEKQALAQSMQTQMQSVLETIGPKGPQSAQVTSGDFLEQKRRAVQEARQQAADAAIKPATGTVEILLQAGRIEYAQLITEANSDVPGPVLAELASGPLAGSRMIGSFKTNEEYLTLSFDTVIVDGIALTANAVALDPNTSLPGVITEIDHKYFQRIILPAAAAFIEGIGGAIGESGSTTVVVDNGAAVSDSVDLNSRQEFFKGVEKASEKLSDIMDKNADKTKPMLRVAAGTHLGILFTKAVERRDEIAQRLADEAAQKNQPQLFPGGAQQFLFQMPQQGQGLMTPVTPQLPAVLTNGMTGTGNETAGQ